MDLIGMNKTNYPHFLSVEGTNLYWLEMYYFRLISFIAVQLWDTWQVV